jgi:hypothetical protein
VQCITTTGLNVPRRRFAIIEQILQFFDIAMPSHAEKTGRSIGSHSEVTDQYFRRLHALFVIAIEMLSDTNNKGKRYVT